MSNITVQVRIPKELNEKLKEFTLDSNMSKNAYIRNAIQAKIIADQKTLKEKGFIRLAG